MLGGIAVGAASVMAPMYISEISPPQIRGRIVSIAQLAIVTGIVAVFFSNYLIATIELDGDKWRYMFWAEAVPAALYFIMLFLVCESPRWLVKADRIEEARKVISIVEPEEDGDRVINEIKHSLAHEAGSRDINIWRQPYLRLILIGICVGMFNQLTGINIIMYYTPAIFKAAGFAESSALLQTVAVGMTNMLFTFVGMALIDKLGRKSLSLIGSIGMPICLGAAGIGLQLEITGLFLLVSMLVFIMFFCTTQGVVIWVILSEMFPNRMRARATAISSFAVWVVNAIAAFLFPVVQAKIGAHFHFLCCCNAGQFLFLPQISCRN